MVKKNKDKKDKDKRSMSVIGLFLVCMIFVLSACSGNDDAGREITSQTGEGELTTEADSMEEESIEEESIGAEPTGDEAVDSTLEEETADEVIVVEMTKKEKTAYKAFDGLYEAEDGILKGSVKTGHKKKGFSGSGYVEGIENDGDGCEFIIKVPVTGFYDLNFISASFDGYKENIVAVDKSIIGFANTEERNFSNSIITKVYLEKGKHSVTMTKSWGWIYLDCLKVKASTPTDERVFEVKKKLINLKADDNTKRLMSFLVDSYGEYTLSGQNADKGRYSKEINAISKVTDGKVPAILGLDLIEYSPSRVEKGSTSKTVEYAMEYDELGGIISLCWHWNAPTKYLTTSEPWWSGFYTKATSIDLAAIMKGEDKEGYKLLVSDIDAIAVQLKQLEEAGVPLLFRPLHEASGGWFWWGATGPEAYKELWYLMYDRLTNYHKLNNLIWVWNGQNKDWYPGDKYVDMIGEDIYPGEKIYTSQVAKFNSSLNYTDKKKIIALTENGCLFDPDLAFRDDARWAWFTTWSGDFVVKSNGDLSEQYTEEYMIQKVYNHELVLTLDELPNLKTYPIK